METLKIPDRNRPLSGNKAIEYYPGSALHLIGQKREYYPSFNV